MRQLLLRFPREVRAGIYQKVLFGCEVDIARPVYPKGQFNVGDQIVLQPRGQSNGQLVLNIIGVTESTITDILQSHPELNYQVTNFSAAMQAYPVVILRARKNH